MSTVYTKKQINTLTAKNNIFFRLKITNGCCQARNGEQGWPSG